jgi:membrane fusion protein (multidrug efflux system)
MSATFPRTLRSLEAGGRHRRWAGLSLAAFSGAWLAWLVLGRVTVYEVTDQAWLEARAAAHPVAAPVEGQVVETRMVLDRQVEAGEELILLDTEKGQRDLAEKRAQRDALRVPLEHLPRQVREEREKLRLLQKNRPVRVDQARLSAEAAKAQGELDDCRVVNALTARAGAFRAVNTEELQRLRTEAKVSWSRARVRALGVEQITNELLRQEHEQSALILKLERERDECQAALVVAEAGIRKLEHDLALRTIRAPVSGRVGDVAAVRPGSVVRAAERLGAIVPQEEARAVALFPAAALGRARAGHPARLRLQGFPWTQYGTLAATVASVGNEPAGGLIRVELTLDAGQASAIPVGHGLRGSAEVEVERVSPAVFLLRAAGQLLGVRPTPGGNGPGGGP